VTKRVVIVRHVQVIQSSSFPHPRLSCIFHIQPSLQILFFDFSQQWPFYLAVGLNFRKVIEFNTLIRSTKIFNVAEGIRSVLFNVGQTFYHSNQLT
jgi:hypothetical protein